ncbi:Eukaryotic aspartyl protease family protein [Forsythia ovata]|uniref:Eukaryotic aspartyl protease family protein n=1 Tax=Forsythia ovata TaxID=205694 RepID=A0ABD1QDB7_9LAMI
MGMLFSLLFTLLLARTSSITVNQEVDGQHLKYPAIHLPLFHMRGRHSLENSEPPLPFAEALARDDARVKSLSRLIKNNLTAARASGHLVDPEAITIPLNPGVSIGSLNYYMKAGLGTPPTFYPVFVDTGSSFSWVQCEPCEEYCHPQGSSTYKSLSCDTSQCSSLKDATLNSPRCTSSNVCIYEVSYADKSYSLGYLSQDSLSLAASSQPTLSDFVFGCGQDNDGLFGQSAGLFGLARNELSMFSQLSTQYGKAFSYCLPTPDGQTGSGGFLSIGTTSSTTTYKFTPMLTDSRLPSLYFLKLSAITVSGKTLNVPPSEYNVPTIIDSGSSNITSGSVHIYRPEAGDGADHILPNIR